MIYKIKRWKRRNRHKNIDIFNAYKNLENMPYRLGRYVVFDKRYGVVVKRVNCAWCMLPYAYKQHPVNTPYPKRS